jgi:hypothetical protein
MDSADKEISPANSLFFIIREPKRARIFGLRIVDAIPVVGISTSKCQWLVLRKASLLLL